MLYVAVSQASIMTRISEDDCSSKYEKKDGEGENDGTITNDPNHPLLKVSNMNDYYYIEGREYKRLGRLLY